VIDEVAIMKKYASLEGVLDERSRRLWAATEAQAIGYGGIALVARAIGLMPETIARGIKEINGEAANTLPPGSRRIRRAGGGRKPACVKDPGLPDALERLIEPVTRGDPESPLRWSSKSVRKLAAELTRQGHPVSNVLVAKLLRQMGYSLQSNRKVLEGADHPDRNAQFEHINRRTSEQIATKNPAISVDTKKKELVGDFKNGGKDLRPFGDPIDVRVHDFILPELGRANPYGVYDIANNLGWVSVGVDHDTAEFAVETIRRWWYTMGVEAHPNATSLLITADGGGSNGSRVRLWKVELQRLADELAFPISVCHLPPGTSKWNKIEHRLFSFITQNWRGKPLVSHAVIVNLIAATKTTTGLKVRCQLDDRRYEAGRKVSDKELAAVNIERDEFHGDWNYTIRPRLEGE